jgi:hypothetical protein
MTLDQLKKFCADADDIRYYLREPWKDEDGRIMAANGHIAVVLNTGIVFGEHPTKGSESISKRINDWVAEAPTTGFIPVPLEFEADQNCEHCDGKPAEPDEDGEFDNCYWCDGTGFNKKTPIRVGNAYFAKHYLRLIATLPACQIATFGETGRACFRFDGGIGFLMPVRS